MSLRLWWLYCLPVAWFMCVCCWFQYKTLVYVLVHVLKTGVTSFLVLTQRNENQLHFPLRKEHVLQTTYLCQHVHVLPMLSTLSFYHWPLNYQHCMQLRSTCTYYIALCVCSDVVTFRYYYKTGQGVLSFIVLCFTVHPPLAAIR